MSLFYVYSTEIPLQTCLAYGNVNVHQVVGGGQDPPHIYEVTDILPEVGVEDEGAYEN